MKIWNNFNPLCPVWASWPFSSRTYLSVWYPDILQLFCKYSILLQKGQFNQIFTTSFDIFLKNNLQIYVEGSISEEKFLVKKWKIAKKTQTLTLFNFLESIKKSVWNMKLSEAIKCINIFSKIKKTLKNVIMSAFWNYKSGLE